MKITRLLAALVTLAGPAAVSHADTVTLNGDTTGAPTYNRTTESGVLAVVAGTAVPYNVVQFTVGQAGNYTLSLDAVTPPPEPGDPQGYDTFVHLYLNNFDPNAAETNFLAANDDWNLSNSNSTIADFALTTTDTYFFVLDGFDNEDFGAYAATLTGPGIISAVPEPSTFLLLGLSLGLGGFVAHRRRHRATRMAA